MIPRSQRSASAATLAALVGILALLAFASCGHPGLSKPPGGGAGPVLPGAPVVTSTVTPASPLPTAQPDHPPARSHKFASLPHRALGPFVATAGDQVLTVWISSSARGTEQELVVAPLALDGAPVGQVRIVAHVPGEATSLVVKPLGGPSEGWLVAWSALLDRGESLTVLGLEPNGAPRGEPTDLHRTSDHIKWVGIVPRTLGALCAWAEETSSGDANILAAPLSAEGKPSGLPVKVAAGVQRWQVVPAGEGLGLAFVGMRRWNDGSTVATLSWQRLDAEARLQGKAVSVARGPGVASDMDVVPVRDGWLFAWTDRTGQDGHVVLASVDPSGRVEGPTPAMTRTRGSSLVAITSGPLGVVLAWQDGGRRSRENRALHLALLAPPSAARVTPPGGVQVASPSALREAEPLASVEIAVSAHPELVATDAGFALLGAARACETEPPRPGPCAGPVVSTFVRFGPRLEPLQTEPLLLGQDRRPASVGWGLVCGKGGRCLALGATNEAPTPIFSVDLSPRASPFAAPLPPLPPADAPWVTGIATVASGDEFIEVAAARIGETTVVATLSGTLDGAGAPGRRRGRGARIALRAIDADGPSVPGPLTPLTTRALPVGGIALVAGGSPDDGAAAAWVARDDGDPHVHLALIDGRARPIREMRLTTSKADATSVALAWAGDGWIVAWVDTRDGNGEVYATKVDRSLKRVARDERITRAPGDAGDVSLAVRGDVVWVAWSDSRESPREGIGDIYCATLHASDARLASDEFRVLSTARHSRSPQIVPAPNGAGALLAWIEDAPTGLEGPSAAMVVHLDVGAHGAGLPREIPLAAAGRPTALILAPSGDTVQVVVARSGPEGTTLDAVRLDGAGVGVTQPWPLVDLDAPEAFDVTLAFAGNGVVFDDVGAGAADRRVRRAAVRWSR